jgi:hypothetical protein
VPERRTRSISLVGRSKLNAPELPTLRLYLLAYSNLGAALKIEPPLTTVSLG